LTDTLQWLFQETAKFQILYPDLAKIGTRAIYGKSPLPEDLITRAAHSTQLYFEELIEAGKRHGEVRPEIDSGVAAFIFTAALTELASFLTGRAQLNPSELMPGKNDGLGEAVVAKIYHQIISILKSGIAT